MNKLVESTISAVILYPDRARIETGCKLAVEAGSQTLIVEDLPLAMHNDSVRVSGAGTAQVRIVSVDVKRTHHTQSASEKVKGLESAVSATKVQLAELSDQIATIDGQFLYLNSLRKSGREFARALASGEIELAKQLELMAQLNSQDEKLRAEKRAINVQIEALAKELARQEAELGELRNGTKKERNQVMVDVDVLTAGDFSLELSYVVSGASWRPLYDVRLIDERVSLTYLAEVRQNTGQDWQDVKLTLSTARPALNQRLPDLHPWYIDEQKPRPVPQPRMMKSRAKRLEMEETMMADATPMAMAAVPVEAMVVGGDGSAAMSFVIDGNSDIPSDGSPHKTTIGLYDLPAKADYISVPKHTDAAFRRATFENKTAVSLLAGKVNLFAGDEFIGNSHLQFTASGEEIEQLFGVEDGIRIERELIKRDTDKKMLRDVRRVAYSYEIKVTNLLSKPVRLELKDHIPLSKHERIKVKLEGATPTADLSDLHELKWQQTIAADSAQTFIYHFTVEHPSDIQLTGLYV